MSKVYISVKGGCIQGIWSTNKKDKVELWDWDNIEAGEFDEDGEEEYNVEKLEEEFEEITKKIHCIF
jgi:hypothetical protein